ncbi:MULTISPECIES: glycosyl hydrolase [unclassified Arcicella]|uniref:glycosyl hydrolase n=1 Tax=unclassified Arcicella TaxID=2644986 RepID=UPI002858978A|nr:MULTISPECIES: glycosyl hydrolase [unclassified Arcicella]MDR6562311.1 mannan endo-1,4-beta-mannosidase [Arcicella sp. BE51]MDR6811994.1 mannan endo-1,4-beta-mannosidase [Arcicella sp. BE140]MDR6823305.1 mannan endo-1,4-beta-mannosidase [Arcicella sp. BE139]
MKKNSYIFVATILVMGYSINLFAQKSASIKLKDRTPKGIVKYFDRLIKDSLIVVGQHCAGEDNNQVRGYQTFFEELHSQTGKYPGLLGLEYGSRPNVPHDVINQMMIDHWNKGGIVTLTWCADNPFKDGYNGNWNAIINKDSINLKSLLSIAPDSKAKASYWTELMQVAKALKKLKDAGVVVLWRPFHEMNGSWFWWGPNDDKQPTNLEDFKILWQDMHKTFRKMGLDNLVWVYAPNNPFSSSTKEAVLTMYPGDSYVDIVGMDIYKAPVPDFTDNYELLKKLNKTIVIAECGDDIDNKGTKVLDETEIVKKYKGKAGYFMQWHSWYNPRLKVKVRRAIIDNPYAKEMMNLSAAVTLDEMK